LFISSTSQHSEACWSWLKALSADASQALEGYPARISVAESEAFTSRAPAGAAEVYKAYREALGRSSTPVAERSFFDTEIDMYWFFRAVDHAIQGEDIERELDDAQILTEQFVACVRAGGNSPECAKQVDPEYEGWQSAEAQPVQ
jgi:hypothetical protein